MQISAITSLYNTYNLNFKGETGNKFLNSAMPETNYIISKSHNYNLRGGRLGFSQADELVKQIKKEFEIKNNKSDDILEALIEKIRVLTFINKNFTEKIDSLERQNSRLIYENNSLNNQLSNSKREARYWKSLAK